MTNWEVREGRAGIEVTETYDAYLVKIHPNDRWRAKRIVGRQWDWRRERWVYPKSKGSFEALSEEFGNDAVLFAIDEPRVRSDRPAARPSDPALEDWHESGAIDDGGEADAFAQLAAGLESMCDAIRGVERSNGQIRTLLENEYAKATSSEDEAADGATEPSVVEAAVKALAVSAAGDDPSFREWLSGLNPILDPFGFVTRTHEILKTALVEFGGDRRDGRRTFGTVVADLRDKGLLRRSPLNVPQALFAMTEHRNWFAHPPPDGIESEKVARSLIYLLNLALVWQLVSAPVDEPDAQRLSTAAH